MMASSRFHNPQSYALNRTFKLPDLYIFPPGKDEMNDDLFIAGSFAAKA